MDFRKVLEKAQMTVADLVSSGGYLNPMQANAFIRMIQDQPTIVKMMRVVPMNAPQMEINKIGFGSRILHAAPTTGNALTSDQRSKATTSKVELLTKAVRAEVRLPYDVLEDNIERGTLETTIMQLISERSSLDIEELVLLGDKDSTDAYLALLDGILKLASAHVVDHTAAGISVSKTVFKEMVKEMPSKYLRNRAQFRFLVSPNTETEYVDTLANRLTNYGDTKINNWSPNTPYGIPLEAAALMPNAKGLLIHPNNMILGIQRNIMIETDRDITTQELIVVVSMRLDVQFEESDAVVKIDGLDPDGDYVPESSTTT